MLMPRAITLSDRRPFRERDRNMFKLLDYGFDTLDGEKKENSAVELPLFDPDKDHLPLTSEAMYRQARYKARRLSESLDEIASICGSRPSQKDRPLLKKAIVDWGRK